MTVVDAHHHLWSAGDGYTWLDAPAMAPIRRTFTPGMLHAELAPCGVRHTVLVEGGRCDLPEAVQLLRHADADPTIAGVVAWADPAGADLENVLRRFVGLPGGHRLVGVRAQAQAEPPDYLDRPAVRRGLVTIGTAGLAFDLVVRPDQIRSAARAANAVPYTRFVLDHLGKPPVRAGAAGLGRWAADIARFAAEPNTYAKLSGLVTEADRARWTVHDLRPWVETALELFGPHRLMFGSDWPVCLLAAGYGEVFAALEQCLPPAMPADDRRAVFGGTAIAAYHLDV